MLSVEEKVWLADFIVGYVTERFTQQEMPVLAGFLTQKQDFPGFQPVEEGHPVLEFRDRYIIYITSLDGKTTAQVPYPKDKLAPMISFGASISA